MRGRKPAPTALKVLKGTQANRINRDEPISPPGVPEPPGFLDAIGKQFWAEHAQMLASMGVLTKADKYALGMLAESFARYRQYPNDQRRRDEFRKMLVEFGLTPSSRSRLKADIAKPADALETFIAKKQA
jgi:phage terminase small subunit